MGKRSDFERVGKDFYPTPLKAVAPLIPYLPESFTFIEPCAGDFRLVNHIETLAPLSECYEAYDIDPQADEVREYDALQLTSEHVYGADFIITNPPWSRGKKDDYLLHNLITHFTSLAPTWLLFDADWAHTVQATPYLVRCEKIVSIGRVKWIEDSPHSGKDNAAWYYFDTNWNEGYTKFYGR